MVLPWGLTALCPSVASIQFTSLLCSPPTRLIFFAELAIWWRTSSVDNCLYFWRLLIFFLFCVHCFFYFFIGVLKCCHHNSINTGQNWQTISQANFYHLKKKVILTLIFWVRLQVKWFVIFPEPLCFYLQRDFMSTEANKKLWADKCCHLSSSCKHGGNFMYEITCLSCC